MSRREAIHSTSTNVLRLATRPDGIYLEYDGKLVIGVYFFV